MRNWQHTWQIVMYDDDYLATINVMHMWQKCEECGWTSERFISDEAIHKAVSVMGISDRSTHADMAVHLQVAHKAMV